MVVLFSARPFKAQDSLSCLDGGLAAVVTLGFCGWRSRAFGIKDNGFLFPCPPPRRGRRREGEQTLSPGSRRHEVRRSVGLCCSLPDGLFSLSPSRL